MEAKAIIKYLRIGPRKVRPVINLVRRKPINEAFDILANQPKKGARLAEQALKSAVANAKVKKMDEQKLVVADIRADGGPVLKRIMSRAMGRVNRVLKRTTHITVIVEENEGILKRQRRRKKEYTEDSKQAETHEKKKRKGLLSRKKSTRAPKKEVSK